MTGTAKGETILQRPRDGVWRVDPTIFARELIQLTRWVA